MSNMSSDEDGGGGGGADSTGTGGGGGPLILLSYLPSFTAKLFLEEDGLFHPLTAMAGSLYEDARFVVAEEIWPLMVRDFHQWKAGLWKELEAYENRREGNTKFQLVVTCLLVFGIAFHLELYRLWVWFTKRGGQWEQVTLQVRLYHQSRQRQRKRTQKLKKKGKQDNSKSTKQSTAAAGGGGGGGAPSLSNWLGGGTKTTLLSPTSTASTTVEEGDGSHYSPVPPRNQYHTPTSSKASTTRSNKKGSKKSSKNRDYRPSGNRENIMLMMQNSYGTINPRPTPDERPQVPRDAYGLKVSGGLPRRTASMDMRPGGNSRYAVGPGGGPGGRRGGSRSPTRSTSMDMSGYSSNNNGSYRSTTHQASTNHSSKLLSMGGESGTSFAEGSQEPQPPWAADDHSYNTPNPGHNHHGHGTVGTITPTTADHSSNHTNDPSHQSSSTKNTNRTSKSRKSTKSRSSRKSTTSSSSRRKKELMTPEELAEYEERKRARRKARRRNTSPMRQQQQPLLAEEELPMRRSNTMDTSSNHNPNNTPNRQRVRKLVGGPNTPLSLAEARNRRRMSERGDGGENNRGSGNGGPLQRTFTGGSSGGRGRAGGEHGYARQMHPRTRSGNGAMTMSASQLYMARQPTAAGGGGGGGNALRNSNGSDRNTGRNGAISPTPTSSSQSRNRGGVVMSAKSRSQSPKREPRGGGGDYSNANYANSPYNGGGSRSASALGGPGPRMARQPSRQELGYE